MRKIKMKTALQWINEGRIEFTQDIKTGINIIRLSSGKYSTVYIIK